MDGEPEGERIARVETRLDAVVLLLNEVRQAQKQNSEAITKSIGGAKVVALLGGLSGITGLMHLISVWLSDPSVTRTHGP